MSKLLVRGFAISVDGYGAGPNQDLENPLGVNGPELMEWFFHTRVWPKMHGEADGETGIDNEIAELGFRRDSARGFSDGTFSGRCEARGRTKAGRAGGATSRRITRPSSC